MNFRLRSDFQKQKKKIMWYSNLTLVLCILSLLVACSNRTELIENRDAEGRLTERFERRTDDFAREGRYEAFDSEGKVIEQANYRNDTLHGERRLFYPDGKVQAIEQYVDGRFAGEYQYFYDDGKLELRGNYVDGAMNGIWTRYYRNGQIMEEVTFVDNEENGPFVEYFESGNLKAEGTYQDGDQEQGILKIYNEDGQLARTMQCDRGICRTIDSLRTER